MPLETLHDERGKALDNTHYAPNHRKWKGTSNNYVNVFTNSATSNSQECWTVSKLARTNRRGEPQKFLILFTFWQKKLKVFGMLSKFCRSCWHLVEGGADEGVIRGAAEAEVGGRVGSVQVPVMNFFTMIWFFRSFSDFRLFPTFTLNSSVM